MKILFELIAVNHKTYHSIAQRIKEQYPRAQFAGIVGYNEDNKQFYDFLKNQTQVKFEFLELWHEIWERALESETDHALLKDFEEKSDKKSLWRYIAADRCLGYEFMRGALWQPHCLNRINTRENILQVFSGLIKEYRRIFETFKPDVFIPAMAMGTIDIFILDQLCKEYGVKYVTSLTARTESYFTFAEDVELNCPRIEETYRQLMGNMLTLDLGPAQRLYAKLLADLNNSDFSDRKHECFQYKKLETWPEKIKFHIKTPLIAARVTRDWLMMKLNGRPHHFVLRKPCDLTAYFGYLKFALGRHHQNYQLLYQGMGGKLPQGQKYIFFPLHISPEHSTQVMGTMWQDQIHVIEALAKSIPFDWVVYVKEHPATLYCRARPTDFYKRLRKLPNVSLAPVYANTGEIIINSEMVAVITGTAGWEAVQRGKPVINFGKCFWDCLDLSRRTTDPERLSVDIHQELKRHQSISLKERERRVICFLASILENSFHVTLGEVFGNSRVGSDEEYQQVAEEVAAALIHYLNQEEGVREELKV